MFLSQINLKKYKEKKGPWPTCSVAGAVAPTPKAPGLVPAGGGGAGQSGEQPAEAPPPPPLKHRW